MSVLDLFNLNGKLALVTGATHGIGFAMAAALAEAGAMVAVNARSERSLQNSIRAYEEAGHPEIKLYLADVTEEEAVRELLTSITRDFGRSVDILVNNAGIISRTPMLDMSAADFRKVVDTDLTACFITAKLAIPAMIKQGGGKIINICSMTSELGRETVASYASAKGGLKMLTKNIASEYGAYNIQCNGLAPGYIATPQTAELRTPEHPFNRFIIGRTPAGRWGQDQDLAWPCVFLASSASNFVNGHILNVDGGILAYLGKQP